MGIQSRCLPEEEEEGRGAARMLSILSSRRAPQGSELPPQPSLPLAAWSVPVAAIKEG